VAIFRINKEIVKQLPLKKEGFGNEAQLRDLFANNLEEILGVRFLEKEYPTTDGRIDTLGLDENNSPVIIEYKWKENEEVLAQGLFYFNWLIKNKKHFELLVENKLGKEVKVSWEQPRVILIAQGFSRYILAAVQQVKNVELKTYNYYEDSILHIESVYSPITIKQISEKKEKKEEDAIIYDLNHHLNITSPEMQKLATNLREKILELPSVEEKLGQKSGITYKTTKSFTRLEFRGTWIQLLLREPKYEADIKKIVKDISSNEWGYRGMVKVTPDSDTDYVFNLVKQSYSSTL
jgi:predicted transport protein